MAPMSHLQDYAEEGMPRVSHSQVLTAILVAGMVILTMVPVFLGVAIQQRAIAPPQLDVRLGRLNLVAATTHALDCDEYVTPCSPELMSSPGQEFYAIWVLISS